MLKLLAAIPHVHPTRIPCIQNPPFLAHYSLTTFFSLYSAFHYPCPILTTCMLSYSFYHHFVCPYPSSFIPFIPILQHAHIVLIIPLSSHGCISIIKLTFTTIHLTNSIAIPISYYPLHHATFSLSSPPSHSRSLSLTFIPISSISLMPIAHSTHHAFPHVRHIPL